MSTKKSVVWRCHSCGQKNRIQLSRWTENPQCGKCQAVLETGKPQAVSGKDFSQRVLESGLPVLVDFWAPWCGPCRMIAPVLEKVAKAYDGRLLVVKVNTDDNPQLSAKWKIQGIPALFFFKDGKLVTQQAGALPEPRLRQWIDSLL